ncbi:MAG: hypothetical protein D6732_18940 [Methanobacteriota archaeon]|nr:MAG: hypothetical protein D6732_18940 [Euryarchaeota archaeon]
MWHPFRMLVLFFLIPGIPSRAGLWHPSGMHFDFAEPDAHGLSQPWPGWNFGKPKIPQTISATPTGLDKTVRGVHHRLWHPYRMPLVYSHHNPRIPSRAVLWHPSGMHFDFAEPDAEGVAQHRPG